MCLTVGVARLRTVLVVQTFLPYPDYAQSAAVLDRQRLGKQRVECLQIFNALTVPGYGWGSHPAVRMWRGYEHELVRYTQAMCDEWTKRGYRDSVREKIGRRLLEVQGDIGGDRGAPPWLGRGDLHRSHRSNLVRKDPEWYAPRFEAGLRADLEYVWPV